MLKKKAAEGIKKLFNFEKYNEDFIEGVRKNEEVIFGELNEKL